MRQIKRGVRREDEFISTMEKIMKYIVRHREKSIIIGVVIVVGAILLVYLLGSGAEQKNPQADLLQTQALGLISSGRIQEAEEVLTQLTQNFQNTRPGKIALYYLGIITYHSGRYDEALEHFDKFLNMQKKDYLLQPSALLGAGSAAEGLRDYERALKYYEQLIKQKDSEFYHLALLAYGRVNGIIGNVEKAKEVLDSLLAQNPSADIAADAKFYLGYFNQ